MNKELKSTSKTKLIAIILAIMLMLAMLVGCDNTRINTYVPNAVFPTEFVGTASNKEVYVTSIGQSIDCEYLSLYLKDVTTATFVENKLLKASEVPNGAVVFIAVGCSLKSMLVSGVDKESELARVKVFLSRAKAREITVIAWHIGGITRRGNTSDSLIEYIFGNADLALFSADGNYDLKLSDWALAGKVPYCQFENNVKDMLRYLYKEVTND